MMKKVITIFIISILVFSLTGCAAFASIPGLNESVVPAEADYSTNLTDGTINHEVTSAPNKDDNGVIEEAPPADEFASAEEAVKKIKAIREAGPGGMAHPNDFKLYEKDHMYLLNIGSPLPGFKQTAIIFSLSGTCIRYENDKNDLALFFWFQGDEKEEMVEERINRYSLEQYKDTKYYFGELFGDVDIHWWENGDEFSFSYPADTGVMPEDVIEYLEVVRYDF
ncbi:MAG: hypothetical protein MJ075_05340 [Oscillospiraceae bacterium]|nr:hypothetical protein [Oscillospiraceae bacterium]